MTSKFLIAAVSASFLFGAAAMAADAPKAPTALPRSPETVAGRASREQQEGFPGSLGGD